MARRLERSFLIRRVAPLALMPGAALSVHQLRYWFAFGPHAGPALQAQGHSYLHSVVPWVVVGLALAAGIFLRALGRAFGGQRSLPRYTVSFAGLWLLCAACLVAIYVAQEFLEGLVVTGHPGGWVGIFGYGGWWSIPAASGVGLVLAAAFHGARWVLHEVAERCATEGPASSHKARGGRVPASALLPRLTPLATGWSGRGPPARPLRQGI